MKNGRPMYKITVEQGMAGHSEEFETLEEVYAFIGVWIRPGVQIYLREVEDE